MAEIIRNADSVLYLTSGVTAANTSNILVYGSIEKADNYFASVLHGQKWEYLDRSLKAKALVSATKLIEQLNFAGTPTVPSQPLSFPRGTDTLVPVAIEEATYELALALLKGIDPDTERDNLSMTVQGYGTVKAEYNRASPPPYIVSGIPSPTAWHKLLPFLEERRAVRITRTD